MAKKYEDVNGSNTWLDQMTHNVMAAVWELGQRMGQYDLGGFVIMEITIRGPKRTGGGYLAIIKGATETKNRSVAFDGAEDLHTLLTSVRSKLTNDGLRWREDVPYDQRKGAQGADKGS